MRLPVCTPSVRCTSSRAELQSFLLIGLFLFPTISGLFAQGADWTEKDLAKNVHRAEESFEAGEMSKAYGLFAHLVSIASERAFLHFRYGSICTYTSSRLAEAEEHLRWAKDLGILETEHASEWHYYQGRLLHLNYNFEGALGHYREAIDSGKINEDWLIDAKLCYSQCLTKESMPIDAVNLEVQSMLVSHSDDYFRLFEMPIDDGRILKTPEALRTRFDKKNDYHSTMHWLPSKRHAFYASYGKQGDTGLDIYRVSVDGMGIYGDPERLPAPINSEFDDCSPICISMDKAMGTADQLFFSSSRPESFGGLDVFQVSGDFFSLEPLEGNLSAVVQLPMEINSSFDEVLYYASPRNKSKWLATNRNQDFEGKEIWQIKDELGTSQPVALQIKIDKTVNKGRLIITNSTTGRELLTMDANNQDPMDLIFQDNSAITLAWKDENGVTLWEESIQIPSATSPKMAMNGLVIGKSAKGEVEMIARPSNYVEEPALHWSTAAMKANQYNGIWFEDVNTGLANELRNGNSEPANIQRILLAQESASPGSYVLGEQSIPSWVVKALEEIGEVDPEETPQTVSNIRSRAMQLQSNMETIHCWEAPGSNKWEVQNAIKRFGEPALGVLSEKSKGLASVTANNVDVWKIWKNNVDRHLAGRLNISQDWLTISDYVNAQVKANESALVQIQDMHRRIEAHLVYDRWITEAFPLESVEFRTEFLEYTGKNQNLLEAIQLAASSTVQREDSLSFKWFAAQEILWNQLTDSIINVQELGVYTLPEMESAQAWFIRSGGLIEDAKQANLPKEQMARGQAAVGLAWETFSKGAQKRDLVKEEAKMTAGQWWQKFGASSENETNDYSGFEMFSDNNAPIIQQAELYLEELDVIRTKSTQAQGYRESMSNAIAMRSSLEAELHALFGGTVTPRKAKEEIASTALPASTTATPIEQPFPVATSKTASEPAMSTPVEEFAAEVNPKPTPATDRVVAASTEAVTRNHFTILIGAFKGSPKDKSKWFNQSTKQHSPDGINRYMLGTFESSSEAQSLLKEIQREIPDAFIKIVAKEVIKVAAKPKTVVKTSKEPEAKAKAKNESRGRQFRLKIVQFEEHLEPTQVARLLRLGNEIPLTTMRSGKSTVYVSKTFPNLEAAKKAMELCIDRGFRNTELQIIND